MTTLYLLCRQPLMLTTFEMPICTGTGQRPHINFGAEMPRIAVMDPPAGMIPTFQRMQVLVQTVVNSQGEA